MGEREREKWNDEDGMGQSGREQSGKSGKKGRLIGGGRAGGRTIQRKGEGNNPRTR